MKEWEQLFWDKFQAFLVKNGKYRVEEKERLTREWRANCWKRLNPQMHAALKRTADFQRLLETLGEEWALSISQFFEGVDNPDGISLSKLKREIGDEDEEMRLRLEKEIDDIEFRLKRGSDLGQFDQFWDDDDLFVCRYSRSKWASFDLNLTAPLEI